MSIFIFLISSVDGPLACNLSLIGPTPQGVVLAVFSCDRRVIATCQVSGRPAVPCKHHTVEDMLVKILYLMDMLCAFICDDLLPVVLYLLDFNSLPLPLPGNVPSGIHEISVRELNSGPHIFILNVQDGYGKSLMKIHQFTIGTGIVVITS